MNQEKVCEIVKQLIVLQEELKQKQAMLEDLKQQLDEAMNNEPFIETPYGNVKLYEYDVQRVSKDKVSDMVMKSRNTPISNLDMVDVTSISDVHYYRILPKANIDD